MINGAGWSHGAMSFGPAPAKVTDKGKHIGDIGADLGGNPVIWRAGGTFKASSLAIFEAFAAAEHPDNYPKENPKARPHKARAALTSAKDTQP